MLCLAAAGIHAQATAGRDAALALLQSGQLVPALAAADAEPDALLRELARAEVYFQARDFPACLHACEAALQADSDHLLTLWVASRAALWLQDGAGARHYADQLRSAAQADSSLSSEERAGWTQAADDYRSQAMGWLEKNSERDSALQRSKLTAAVVGLVLLAAFIWLLRDRASAAVAP